MVFACCALSALLVITGLPETAQPGDMHRELRPYLQSLRLVIVAVILLRVVFPPVNPRSRRQIILLAVALGVVGLSLLL
jgi:hypothetical protein